MDEASIDELHTQIQYLLLEKLRLAEEKAELLSGEREARAAAEGAEQRLRAVLRQMPVGVVIAEAPSGRVVLGNEEASRILGDAMRRPASVEAYREWRGYRPDGRAYEPEEWPLARAVRAGESVEGEEIEHLRADGSRCVVRVSASPIRDAGGRTVAAVATFDDVTDRRQLEEALREEARLVETLQRIGGSLTSELDLQRVVQAVTDEATALTTARFGAFFYNVVNDEGESYTLYTLSGVSRSAFEKFPMPRNTEVFGPTFRGEGVVRSDDITADPRYGRNAPHHGMPKGHLPVRSYLAVPVVSRTGEVLGGLFFGHPDAVVFTERHERIAVGIAGWAAVAMDNARLYEAERRARAEAEAANRAKSDFLAVMSHELRTPLNAIVGYTDLWLMGLPSTLPESVGQQVERVRWSAKHLLELIEEILTFSRIEAGREEVWIERVELGELLEGVAALVEPLAMDKGLRFALEAPPAPGDLETDGGRLRQILINLISNAIKFTGEGEVRLVVERRDEALEFRVRDTGVGIAPEHLEKVFEPFWQAEEPTTRRAGGTGLGLPVSRRLARMLGGDVTVASTPGVGTTVTVRVPRRVPVAAEPGRP